MESSPLGAFALTLPSKIVALFRADFCSCVLFAGDRAPLPGRNYALDREHQEHNHPDGHGSSNPLV